MKTFLFSALEANLTQKFYSFIIFIWICIFRFFIVFFFCLRLIIQSCSSRYHNKMPYTPKMPQMKSIYLKVFFICYKLTKKNSIKEVFFSFYSLAEAIYALYRTKLQTYASRRWIVWGSERENLQHFC